MDELIAKCEKAISDVLRNESTVQEEDRIWQLRKNFNNWLYSRGLQNYAPQLIESILAYTSVNGLSLDLEDSEWSGAFDFTQKHYTGFKRKFTAVIGNRMPNAIAVPNNPSDEEGVRATKSANPAAIYLRESCDLEGKHLEQAGRMFDNGTTFWHIDWVEDGEKYGYRSEPVMGTEQKALGNARFECPNCGAAIPSDSAQPDSAPETCPQCGAPLSMDHFKAPDTVNAPAQTGVQQVPNGQAEITIHDSTEIWVPFDAKDIDDCDELRYEREIPKGRILKKYGERGKEKNLKASTGFESNATQLGALIRSAMSSPLGLVRANRDNMWTCQDIWWTPNQYELIDDGEETAKQLLQQNFPQGVRLVYVKGKLLEMLQEKLQNQWHECKPEPGPRIMTDALGDEWTDTTDILNNTTNMMEENVMRSNIPTLVNSQKFDLDAWQNRRTKPGEFFGILPRANRALADEVFQPQPLQFSEQTPGFAASVIDYAKNNSGLNDAIWGGGEPDPTARQTLLKTNQALMQLGLFWTQIRKSLEQVMLKGCKLLADHVQGIVSFSKKNQFGKFDTISFTAEDLKSNSYHFEADEAIPINWGQQRDQLMWLLGQAAESPKLLDMLGVSDPMNIFEIKQLLGIPGMHTDQFDAREKGMNIIAQLISDVAPGPNGEPPSQTMQPGPPGPDGQPGPPQPTVQPDWEDPHQFMADLVKAYLLDNDDLRQSNPDAYQNIQAYGMAQDQIANPPEQPPPPKETVSFAVKPADIGPQATQAILSKNGLLDGSVPVTPAPDPKMIQAQASLASAAQPAAVNGAPAPAGPPIQ